MDIHPTKTCFDDAMEFFGSIKNREDYYLCHGILWPEDTIIYSHAWVLNKATNTVYDFGIVDGKRTRLEFDLSVFIEMKKPFRVTYYDENQVLHHSFRFFSYGPWERKYYEACQNEGNFRKRYDQGKSFNEYLGEYFKLREGILNE